MSLAESSFQLKQLKDEEIREERDHLLVFSVGDCRMALDVNMILEVQVDVDAKELSEPEGPVSHSIPFRGFTIPGIAPQRAFGVQAETCRQMVILDIEDQPVALLIDRLVGLYEVEPEGLMLLPLWLKRCSGTPIQAAFEETGGALVLVLDGKQLFRREDVDILKSFG